MEHAVNYLQHNHDVIFSEVVSSAVMGEKSETVQTPDQTKWVCFLDHDLALGGKIWDKIHESWVYLKKSKISQSEIRFLIS